MVSVLKIKKCIKSFYGHEAKGISQDVLNVCDEVVSIEMQEGVKSFNVAVAASIMMYKLKFTV